MPPARSPLARAAHAPRRAARRARAAALAALAAATLAGCGGASTAPWASVAEVTPAGLLGRAARDPGIALDHDGHVALTWVTPTPDGRADAWVALSSDSGAHFSPPQRVNPDPGGVTSYAESPPVAAFGHDGELVVAWAAARPGNPDAADVAARASADGGRSWGAAVRVNDDHADTASTYHGFASLDVLPDGRFALAWLDGRAARGLPPGNEPARAEVRVAVSADGGATWSASVRAAGDACPCCRPALRAGADGAIAIAYRGARDDLRDPRLALSRDGGATFAADTLISADRWQLPGCPSSGPALTWNRAGGGHYAWFTGESPAGSPAAGRPAPGVYLVPWRAGQGAAGMKRAIAAGLPDAARPLLAPLGAATLVGVVARSAGLAPHRALAVRALDPDGTLTPWLFLGAGVRAATLAGGNARAAWAAWTERDGAATRVRVARLVRR